MTRWLSIEARFLAGRYHGRMASAVGRDYPAEWPPSPYRLFQALIAAGNIGFRRTEFSDAKKEALRWLERRGPPEIAVPQVRKGSPLRLYVPNNDMDKVAKAWAKNSEPEKQPSELRTAKDLLPNRIGDDATVRFLWPIAEDEWEKARPHAELLCVEARHLHALGLGIDLVAGNGRILSDSDKAALPGEVYLADEGGGGWRLPVAGSLDELTGRHAGIATRIAAACGRRAARAVAPPSPPSVWREVAYRRRAAGRARTVHAFALAGMEDESRSFDPTRAIEVAAWLRHAAHMAAKGLKLDTPFVEAFVCGHGEDEAEKNARFSYLPLPTLPHKGRDGRIRRVLLAEPFGGGGGKALAVARRLRGAPLVEENAETVMAELNAVAPADGVFRRYLGEVDRQGRPLSTVWGTVTPIVLPGRDDRRSRKAVGLVLKALAQAGYTTPVAEVTLQAAPVFPGQEMAGRYRVPVYLRPFRRTHAIVTFAEAVPGPIAIGGGRHVGLGVMATVR